MTDVIETIGLWVSVIALLIVCIWFTFAVIPSTRFVGNDDPDFDDVTNDLTGR